MTEEIKAEEPKVEAKAEEPQYSESEKQAMSQGWKPQDQWEGDPDEWVSARQFLKNGELFGRINSYKHKIQGLEKSVEALVKHNESVYDAGYKAAEAQLKAQRRVALQEGDAAAVEEIEEKIEELKTEHTEKKQEFKQATQPSQQTMHPSWEPWVERNSWYASDPALRGFADGLAKEIVDDAKKQGVNIEFDKLLTEVGRKVKEQFPNKFRSASSAGQRPNVKDDSSAGASSVRKTKNDDIEASMSPMEVDLMNTIIRSGVSKEKYLADYKKVQGKTRG